MCDTLTIAVCRESDATPTATHIRRVRDTLEELERGEQLGFFRDNHSVTESIMKALKTGGQFYRTGLKKLDNAMDGGLYAGKSYGFAARKKTGKTALAVTISANLNQNKVPHAFIAAEMNAEELQQRILARQANIFPSAFRTPYKDSQDFFDKVTGAIASMPKFTYFVDGAGMTFDRLRQVVPAAIELRKMKGFILDYWQLVGGKQKGQSTSEHLDEVAQWIAAYCKQTGCFAVVMAQLNQDDNTRGSEGIRLAFDQVYSLIRSDLGQPHTSMDMLETRYTAWQNISGLWLNPKGPYIHEEDVFDA
jgi:replicative DNA helicase